MMLREIILTQQMQYNKVWLLSQISDTRFPVQLTKQSERWPEAQKTHSYGFIYNLLKHSRKLVSHYCKCLKGACCLLTWILPCLVFCWLCKLIEIVLQTSTLGRRMEEKRWKKFPLWRFLDVLTFTGKN